MSTSQILKSLGRAPKLDHSTYSSWSSLFERCLISLERENFILKGVPGPSKSSNSTADSKSTDNSDLSDLVKDNHIMTAILQLVPEKIYYLLEAKTTSKEMWDTLRTYYHPRNEATLNSLLEEFWTLSMDEGTDVDKLANKLTERQSRIAALDNSQRTSDSIKKNRLLGHFDKHYNGYYFNHLRTTQSGYKQSHPVLFVALSKGDESKKPSSSKKKSCSYCKRRSHTRNSCFLCLDTPDGSNWAAKNPEKAAKNRLRKKNFENQNNSKASESSPKEGMWMIEDHALSSTATRSDDDIVLDTGATHHIFRDESLFTTMSPYQKSVRTASGNIESVSGIGSVEFRIFDLQDPTRSKTIKIEDVWYLPNCTKNLVSGSQLVSRGLHIKSSPYGLGVYTSQGVIAATARPKDGLFCFNTASNASVTPQNLPKVFLSDDVKKTVTELIHNRFAHAGLAALRKIDTTQLKAIESYDLSNFKIDIMVLKECDTCNSCKQVEKINRGPIPRSLDLHEIVHSDVRVKCCVAGLSGSFYFATFTDDCSRESEVYVLKSTKEVPEKFQKYKERKELSSGRKVRALRCDGGAKYKTIDYGGIVRQVSAPYNQHQNEVSERLNRTLVTVARCMLTHAGLPLRFWDAEIMTAYYIRNRMPLHEGNLTPFEKFSGVKPVISYFKVWGCVCNALIDNKDPQRYKISPTLMKGIFVGYCESASQYQVYVPKRFGRDKVIFSANVRFLEDKFWDLGESSEQFEELEIHVDEILHPSTHEDRIDPSSGSYSNSDSDSDTQSSINDQQMPPSSTSDLSCDTDPLENDEQISVTEILQPTPSSHENTSNGEPSSQVPLVEMIAIMKQVTSNFGCDSRLHSRRSARTNLSIKL
ncbi:hypothetical protein K3495_g9830 [Podosphaera aphanis]|nr:hypothetical protein K3495_g9830 [Podosphaera aphanis]